MAKMCDNCGIALGDDDPDLCPACNWLNKQLPDTNDLASRGTALDRLTNRRWQMRFHRGEIQMSDMVGDALDEGLRSGWYLRFLEASRKANG